MIWVLIASVPDLCILSTSYGFVSTKNYDKCDDFDFDIINFPFLDGVVPIRPSNGVNILQLIFIF